MKLQREAPESLGIPELAPRQGFMRSPVVLFTMPFAVFINHIDELVESALIECKRDLVNGKQSRRNAHIPALFEMAVDHDFRTKAIEVIRTGRGEWPVLKHHVPSSNQKPMSSSKADWRKTKWIKQITREDWELYFEACEQVIDHFGLDASSPLLAMNIHQNSSDGVLMNLSNRATIDMHLGAGTQVMLMLPKGATNRLLSDKEIIVTSGFERPATADATRVSMGVFREHRSDLLMAVFEAGKELLDRSQSSPFRKHHMPELYRMATDVDFREKALDYLLEDKGEWPGSSVSSSGQADPISHTDETMHDLNTILYGPPGTGKTYELLRQLKDRELSERAMEADVVLSTEATFWHLAPGGGGHLWAALRTGHRLGYEWASKSYGDLSSVKRETVGENYNIITRLAQVRKGDYICVISGKRLLGLAETLEGYSYERSMAGPFDFQTIEVEWIRKFDPPLLLSKSSTPAFTRIGSVRWDELEKALAQEGISIGSETVRITEGNPDHLLVTFHQSFSYEDFVEGIKPELSGEEGEISGIGYEMREGVFKQACNEAAHLAGYADLSACIEDSRASRAKHIGSAPHFHLVIDEINRGNVAGIFGELITLIEPDKRLGCSNEVIVTLPYSQTRFGVPGNLRITGTMNTADRSVEALDTALRRRFSFVEMRSRPELIEEPQGFPVRLQPLLSAINGRIERLLDKDHHIGHSYFMDIHVSDDSEYALRLVFKNKVLPLLQEYFYGDPRKLGAVLGPKWVVKREVSKYKLFGKFDLDDAGQDVFDVADPMDVGLEAFAELYD